MMVRELIALLEQYPQDLRILIRNCHDQAYEDLSIHIVELSKYNDRKDMSLSIKVVMLDTKETNI